MVVVIAIVAIIFILIAVVLLRTLMVKPTAAQNASIEFDQSERAALYGEKLSKMIQVETISEPKQKDRSKFLEFHKVLEKEFPNVHKTCEKNVLNGSLLFCWKGSGEKAPIMFMSHHDVVEAGGEWEHGPFSGDIDETGRVWGRGAVDTKASLCCIFGAIEELIAEGYIPPMDVYIASSCTEEVSGDGGPAIASYLKEKGVKLDLILDEGGMILQAPIAGVKGIYAMVGVVEKGYGDVKFIAHGKGGHASAPGKNTPLVRLGKFMTAVEKKNPFKSQLTPTVKEMFARMAPNMSFPLKMIMSNLWLFEGLLAKVLPSINAAAGAMIRTTLAFTKAKGSDGLNVLPQTAYVTGNMRFIHHQPTDESIQLISDLAKEYDLETEVIYKDYPCPIVDFNSRQFHLIETVVEKVFPGVGTCPYVMTGGTDCKFYSEVCENAIRLAPLYIDSQQYASIHGLNENISSGVLPKAVDFYKEVVKMN
ncbi:MAG: M20/M25/M40 family metallo-hydrolase [Lachnospiraceae bacterium]|nr:M20/M25/M40 family metallo-hydrolase [Lachnospiraceae bacterium]